MTDNDELAAAMQAVSAALNVLAVPWAIGGSIASAFHGEPRATNDVDVVAALDEAQARKLTVLLGDDFYADEDSAAEAARRKRSFNVIDTRTFIKIDIFVPAPGALGLGQLDRRVMADVFPGVAPLPVLGAEDAVLQKLRWYRLTGGTSDRQWRDIVSVLRLAPSLDEAYLDRVAATGRLEDLLARARADVSSS